MRKIVFRQDNSKSIGCDGAVLEEWPNDATDEELTHAHELACAWVSSWFDIIEGYDELSEYDDENDFIELQEIEGWWEEYNPKKHDGIL